MHIFGKKYLIAVTFSLLRSNALVSAFDFLALVSAFDADIALRSIFAVHRFFIFIRLLLHRVCSTSFSVHKIFPSLPSPFHCGLGYSRYWVPLSRFQFWIDSSI